ncbi:chitin deacetylase CDA4 [Aspergillus undulatus]|uniref:chitin deacetylase CDA4 n=1 Tax=Aspergillus undulatus TaxID=1810928 RepID=UPI003CCD0858
MPFCYRSYRHSRRKRQRLLTLALPILAFITLTLPFYIIYKPPHLLVSYFARKYPDILWHVPYLKPGTQPIVALTIDDAPTEFTPAILDVLRENDAKATFFLIGDHIPGREGLMRDAVNEGHELANHAMHDEPSKDLSDQELSAQIQAVQSRIQRIYAMAGRQAEAHDEVKLDDIEQDSLFASGAGVGSGSGSSSGSSSDSWSRFDSRGVENAEGQGLSEVGESIPAVPGGPGRYFRPGSGFFTDRMRALVQRHGFRLVLGSVYPHDPQISYPWVNAAHVLSMVRPGSIIIVHDRRPWTAPMLATVLPELKRRGYRIGTVSDLLKEGAVMNP